MKKILRFLICGTMLSGIAAGAVIGLKGLNSDDVSKADAASVTGSFTKQTALYYSSSSDPSTQYISRQNMSTSSTWGTNNFSASENSLSLTLNETSPNGNWHSVFVTFYYTITIPAYSKLNLSFPCNIATYRDQTSGEADHVAEIQFYDSVSYDSLPLLQLFVDKDNPSTASIIGTGKTDDSGVTRATRRTSGTESASRTFQKIVNNYNNTSKTYNFYFGFFGYIEQSSYNHQWNSTLGISATASTSEYHASTTIGSSTTYYTTFTSAFNAACGSASGGTINLFADESYTNGFYASQDVTINLNGHTLTRTDAGASIFGVAEGKKLKIVGGGGKVVANGNNCVVYVNEGGTLETNGVTLQNTQSGETKYAIQCNSGGSTIRLNSGTILRTNGGHGIHTNSGGNAIYCYGVTTYTSTLPAISLDNSTAASKNTLYIGSDCSFGSYIYINNNAYTNLYSYCDGVTYSGSQTIKLNYGTLPNANDVIFNMISNSTGTEAYKKFVIDNAPVYMSVQRLNTDPTKAIYAYVKYNVTLNTTNVVAPSYSYVATHENDLSITFSGTTDGYYALPSSITVKINNITKVEGSDYSWNQSTGVVTIYASKIVGNINITITGVATDKKAVADFVTEYMHMSDYTQELGYCSDSEHHYYSTAKAALLALGTDCVNEFRTNSAFELACNRYIKWAAANHDSDPFGELNGSKIISYSKTSNIGLLILVISVTSLSLLTIPLIYFKKKRR